MGRIFSIVAAIAALMVLVTGAAGYWLAAANVRDTEQSSVTAIAGVMSVGVASQIDTLQKVVDGLAQSPEVANALAAGAGRADLDKLAARLQDAIPQALRVRILPATVSEPELTQTPNMGFADLEMVRATLTAKQKPMVQGEGEHRHLAITSAVVANQQTLGAVLVSLKPDLVQQLLSRTIFNAGLIEIKQDQSVIASAGNPAAKLDEPQSLPLTNTRWQLDLWIGSGDSTGNTVLFASIVLIPAMLACLGFFIGYRKLHDFLHHDQSVILKAAKDMMAGKKVGNYPVLLEEMQPIISALAQFKRILQQEQTAEPTGTGFADDHDFFDESFDIDFVEEAPQPAAEPFATAPISLNTAPIVLNTAPITLGQPADAEPGPPPHPAPASSSAPKPSAPPPRPARNDFADSFRGYDIRGVVGRGLTQDGVRDIGAAFASLALEQQVPTVVVGRDGRLSSPALAEALVAGIRSTGCNVLDIGLVPTPLLYFVARHCEGRTGIMITGSHNPPDYNGLKLVLNGETLAGPAIQQLKQRTLARDFRQGELGKVELNTAFSNEYIGTIADDVHLVRPMKVVVDCGNGAAGLLAPLLLKTMGCDIVELFCDIDGHFPNHHPDPSKPENLADLIGAVKHYGADVGVAFDGDADRLGVVDSSGKIIWPDRQLMLFARDVLAGKPGSEVIFDVKCSKHLEEQIRKRGGQPLMWKSGHSMMKAKLHETGAALAGEMSGHIFFNDRWFGFDDGLYAAARLIEILSADMRSSSDVFSDLPDSISTPELLIPLAEGEAAAVMTQLAGNARFPNAKVIDIDGLRIEFADGWGLIRASNTTPALTARFEADTKDALRRIQDQFKQLLLQIKPDLDLPF
ncbi:phosphomannomutase/phosphoglucomutase [Methylomonas sp. MED-D]|uniref:phosphomannomutase/phosphoglucomutase n=1 Tax=Methylomonas sp. MED-D TaxID=3418768 RepID=UPI003D0445DA